MKYLGEYIRETAKSQGIHNLDVELGRRLGCSRQAIFSSMKILDTSLDNIKTFRRYMEALGKKIDISIIIRD